MDEWDAYLREQRRKIAAGLMRALDRAIDPPMPPDPNPFPRFHLFRRSRPQAQRCTGDPCICTNGIGCVLIPVELW